MKINLILVIYDMLIRGGGISRKAFCEEHAISERTFYRYVHDISVFLMRNRPDMVIDVAVPDSIYYLKICGKE